MIRDGNNDDVYTNRRQTNTRITSQTVAPTGGLTYNLEGIDPDGHDVYTGSDGNMYTGGGPDDMNGFVSYTGPGVAQQSGDAPVEDPAVLPPTTGGGGGGGYTPPPPSYNFPDFSKLFADQAADRKAQSDKADGLFNFLMGKAKQAEAVDPNDPTIRKQADTFAASQTRQGRRYLQELAEKKGSGGNIGAESRMIAEKGAQASAENEGQIYQHELDARRQEIMQSLSQASQFMTAQQQMSLQEELATIDAQMKKASLDQSASQFDRGLAQSSGQFGATMSARTNEFEKNLAQRAYEYDTDDEFRRTNGS